MTQTPPVRDERTTSIENAGYRWSYLLLSFGLLAIVAVRGLSRGEQPWDLLVLVLLGGAVNSVYQVMHRVLYRRWILMAALTAIAAMVLAALMTRIRS